MKSLNPHNLNFSPENYRYPIFTPKDFKNFTGDYETYYSQLSKLSSGKWHSVQNLYYFINLRKSDPNVPNYGWCSHTFPFHRALNDTKLSPGFEESRKEMVDFLRSHLWPHKNNLKQLAKTHKTPPIFSEKHYQNQILFKKFEENLRSELDRLNGVWMRKNSWILYDPQGEFDYVNHRYWNYESLHVHIETLTEILCCFDHCSSLFF